MVFFHCCRKLAELGYHRSAKASKENIEQVNLTFEKAKDRKRFMQFGELEAIYNGGSRVNNGGTPNATLQEEILAKSKQQNKKKRKRKHLASIKTFLETLVKQLLENQEALDNKFMEAKTTQEWRNEEAKGYGNWVLETVLLGVYATYLLLHHHVC